jgi:hypothetical protein
VGQVSYQFCLAEVGRVHPAIQPMNRRYVVRRPIRSERRPQLSPE